MRKVIKDVYPLNESLFQVKLNLVIRKRNFYIVIKVSTRQVIITFEPLNLSSNHTLTSSTCNYKDRNGKRRGIKLVITYSYSQNKAN